MKTRREDQTESTELMQGQGDRSSSRLSCVPRRSPSVLVVPLLLFTALCGAGLAVNSSANSQSEDAARQEALELAKETGEWFSNQLDQAILPLFSLAQFVSELDIFHDLPQRIGPPLEEGSLPFVPKSPQPTHRNVSGVCDDPPLVQRFSEIAATIKRNAGMEGVLVNLQVAPQAVVCLVHPKNNTEDFKDGIYMDNSGAIGHDLLYDPARKFIAQATLPAEGVVIAGPLTLAQCFQCDPAVEMGFIARLPIDSIDGRVIEVDGVAYPRWGFAVALINWNALVERSSLYESFDTQGISFQLTRTDRIISSDGQSEDRVVVLAEAPNWDPEQTRTVTVALETTDNQWEMSVSYGDPRDATHVTTLVAVIVGSALLSILVYVVLAQKQIQSDMQAQQANFLVKTAVAATAAEHELNDYISHEIRNPLSAAIAASSFVRTAVGEVENRRASTTDTAPLLQAMRDDLGIVDQSLHFIDELLRSMLDMHRAASRDISLHIAPLSVKDDIFAPVVGMLYQRDECFSIIIDCPDSLIVQADRLRLQQIILNLARNATKFVTSGFIQLRAAVENNSVCLYVEDSGPGIPLAKRSSLFRRYQESLDSLNQGTGVGLYLCKKLVDLMEGDIYLDESFSSGVSDCPGTRIVVDLKIPPECASTEINLLNADSSPPTPAFDDNGETSSSSGTVQEEETVQAQHQQEQSTLPEDWKVLLVDDDRTLRKLVSRSLRKVAPSWTVSEASSGETALRMVTECDYDLIFMDQYMASAGHSLKGTETTRALRANRVRSFICGLSANDMESNFIGCGADAFLLKPFPCRPDVLRKTLEDFARRVESDSMA